MPTAGQNKSEASEQESKEGAASQPPSPSPGKVTITLPSLANLPPLPPVQMEPKRLLWLGGLAALGVIGVLEWPVVAVVGVGSYVAERFARDEIRKARGTGR
ncbi:hypothetical protein AB6813_15960 [bacterium RCC_150]